ncbi:glycerophosphodiester phosphodiesterase family protein [Phenylobacterium sp.]|uniref:glycerophosphodiester phosphodiesterase family protein n=1 Tax=Phenylobacterium sp. TaxID=1871053 RepID=UPI002732E377|nr:glycerophosphodiester phosphodiesterase family protein [Phenylobacterium sp.]MDP3660211.1 glycerophosphodiester phosphodiesterase family protein [Phenylobacterium sp.]
MKSRFGQAWELLFDPPVAHRGLWSRGGAPENSLAAFQCACAAGYGIELDVQLSADGEAMVFHDDELARLTGQPGRLREHAAADLMEMRLGGGEERIPTLLEALAVIGRRAMVHIELKTPLGEVGPLEQRVHEVLIDHAGPACVIGFNPYSHAWFAERFPGVLRGFDVEKGWPAPRRDPGSELAEVPLARAHFLALSVDLLDHPETATARAAGTPVLAWTIRSAEQRAQLAGACDNIIFEGFAA